MLYVLIGKHTDRDMKRNVFQGITTVSILVVVIAMLIARQPNTPTQTDLPYMGIGFTSIAPLGVRVDGVRHGSPAAEAGLQPGDVIYAIDKHYLNEGDLLGVLRHYQPQDTIKLRVKRGRTQHQMLLTLQDSPNTQGAQNLLLGKLDVHRDGMTLHNVSFDAQHGVWLVQNAQLDSVLHDAGLRSGDQIIAIDDHQITDGTRYHLMTAMLYQEQATLTVVRGSQVMDLAVPARLAELLLLNIPPTP